MSRPRHSVQVPKESISALRCLVGLGPDGIKRLKEALDATGPSLDHPGLRAVAVSQHMQRTELVSDLEEILSDVVFPLRSAIQSSKVSIKQIVSALDAVFQEFDSTHSTSESLIKPDDRNRWSESRIAISELINSDMMKLEAKGEELLRTRPNYVLSMNIYSDVRPIFDDRAERVTAKILNNCLKITYMRHGKPHEESYSLDPDDLIRLKQQVERALTKNLALANDKQSDSPTLVVKAIDPEAGEHQ
jgi:hypothetical protein